MHPMLSRLRQAAAAVAHVSGARAKITAEDGSRTLVSHHDRDDVAAERFRSVVVSAWCTGTITPVVELLGGVVPVTLTIGGDDRVVPLERGRRWRHACAFETVDYLITELEFPDAVAIADTVLAPSIRTPARSVLARRDPGLAVTVLACSWPTDLPDDDAAALEEGLRDLAMMCRIRQDLATA